LSSGKLRVGVIGVGAIGIGHVSTFKANPRCELTAICDVSPTWVEKAKQDYEVKHGFTSFEDLIACDEVDAVAVCLPTMYHEPATVAALRAGKHVLCEKPMATNADQARSMADAARESGRTLMISYNQRFGPDIQFIKRHIDAGNLGEIYFARTGWRRSMGALPSPTYGRPSGEVYNRNWFNEKAKGGGVTTDLGSHVVDLAMYLMGFPRVREVTGCAYNKFLPGFLEGRNVACDADDHSVGFVKFENGASMQFEASFGCFVEGEMVFQAIYGTTGGAHRESGSPVKLFSQANGAYLTTIPRIDIPHVTPMDHFVECVLEGRTPLVTPEEGIAVTEILDGIYNSSGS
jgi:predicted dehydrogenase